jgi:hypothetical protein
VQQGADPVNAFDECRNRRPATRRHRGHRTETQDIDHGTVPDCTERLGRAECVRCDGRRQRRRDEPLVRSRRDLEAEFRSVRAGCRNDRRPLDSARSHEHELRRGHPDVEEEGGRPLEERLHHGIGSAALDALQERPQKRRRRATRPSMAIVTTGKPFVGEIQHGQGCRQGPRERFRERAVEPAEVRDYVLAEHAHAQHVLHAAIEWAPGHRVRIADGLQPHRGRHDVRQGHDAVDVLRRTEADIAFAHLLFRLCDRIGPAFEQRRRDRGMQDGPADCRRMTDRRSGMEQFVAREAQGT